MASKAPIWFSPKRPLPAWDLGEMKAKYGDRLVFMGGIDVSENADIWMLQAGIFPENVVSVELHRRVGFRVVGVREKLGQMDGIWRDVVLMERRSPT